MKTTEQVVEYLENRVLEEDKVLLIHLAYKREVAVFIKQAIINTLKDTLDFINEKD
jgi:hypothetical protein